MGGLTWTECTAHRLTHFINVSVERIGLYAIIPVSFEVSEARKKPTRGH
jgi:hypothetical protein